MKSLLTGCVIALTFAAPLAAQDAPFGTEADTNYAAQLWGDMVASGFAGEGAVKSFPYEGTQPHGMLLETFYTTGTVDGHTGDLIIKRNYGPEGVTTDEVLANPEKHLGAITVMYRREAGYDEDNANWFWAKFLPDGSLDKNGKGMELAGRVAKGADAGCIACHSSQEDYIFTTDHITN